MYYAVALGEIVTYIGLLQNVIWKKFPVSTVKKKGIYRYGTWPDRNENS
ncbi:hypothetical protein EJP617_32570 [Erwinia sp. Ejp617]|nr:hypothetical protein EJP617_32570 [Erwinia sp. Ejp617]